ncbi:MAG: nucleotidyltransferase domain-containing protein [Bryobacterales bacterium]|nr:nucleotidyltransferase domain-containing protein [Bryobacterales bacterium]
MTTTTDPPLDRMVKAIVDEVAPEQVILFGSRACGGAAADSDVDLVVVEAAPFGPGRDRRAEAARLCRALADFDVSKDILVYSSDEVEYWRDSLNHVLARALREGQVLYERP